jgi:uncharacterized membrane protein (DUF441 family)
MKNPRKFLLRKLHHQKLSKSTSAVAGLTSAISVVVGLLAARMAPKGLAKLPVALHFTSKPLIVKLAPYIAGVAVACATAAGLVKFYSWCLEHDDDHEDLDGGYPLDDSDISKD